MEEARRRGVIREGVHDLLGGPGGGGMFRHVEVKDTSAMVGENDQNEEHAQAHCGNREEIEGDQVPEVIGQECTPVLSSSSSRFPRTHHRNYGVRYLPRAKEFLRRLRIDPYRDRLRRKRTDEALAARRVLRARPRP